MVKGTLTNQEVHTRIKKNWIKEHLGEDWTGKLHMTVKDMKIYMK